MPRLNLISALLLVPGVLLTSGCAKGDQDASKSNFKRVIGQVLQGHPRCIPRTVPATLPLQNGKAQPNSQLNALLRVGLAEAKPAMLAANLLGWGPAKASSPLPVPGMIYELSAKGRKYEGSTPGVLGGPIPGLCYATPEIVEVLRYTEPVNTSFGRVTRNLSADLFAGMARQFTCP